MSRYPLKLPLDLKQDAEDWAAKQGVSLNQFIVWAVAEKIGGLKVRLADPRFPRVEYRTGASGWPTPVLRGMGVRVQTIAVALYSWKLSPQEVADEWGVSIDQVNEAAAFYEAHRSEIDTSLASERKLEEAVA